MQEWVRVTANNAHQLRIGDRLLEQDYGRSIYSIVTSLPQSNGDQWTWTAANVLGGTINYLITAGYEYYVKVYVARGDDDELERIDTGISTPTAREPETVQ